MKNAFDGLLGWFDMKEEKKISKFKDEVAGNVQFSKNRISKYI